MPQSHSHNGGGMVFHHYHTKSVVAAFLDNIERRIHINANRLAELF